MIIYILGGNGLLGKRISDNLKRIKTNRVIKVTKNNYNNYKNKKCDIFINANGNSSKFIGNKYPVKDFKKSVNTTYNSLFDFKFNKYIFLSSIDVYSESKALYQKKENSKIDIENINHYGFNKFISENIVKHYAKSFIILRIGNVIDARLKKNHIFDMISNKKVFVNQNSKTSLISGEEIAIIVNKLIKKKTFNQTYNLCGKNIISYKDIDKYLKLNSNFDIFKPKQIFGANVDKLQNKLKIKLNTEKFLKKFIKA